MVNEQTTTLYKLSKTGSILHFEVIGRAIEDGAVLITRKGKLGGAMQEDIEPMYPKNVGRANETTPWQQCQIMTASKIGKLGDKGYKIISDPNVTIAWLQQYLTSLYGTDINGNLLPMLAQKDTEKIKLPGYLQRKYDGVRNLMNRLLEHAMRSRRGKFFHNLEHIVNDLPNLPVGWEYDGELYHHDRSLQQIVSMIKTKSPKNLEIQYRVYDIMNSGLPYKERKKYLRKILTRKAGPSVHYVPTYWVETWDEIDTYFKLFREEGYEGAMWRDPNSLYEAGERSWGLIKIKDFEEEDFEIIAVNEATGRDAGTALFQCITEDGVEFDCRPMGTRAKRREYLEHAEDLIGEMLTVRFQAWTDRGSPFHQRGVIIRDYE